MESSANKKRRIVELVVPFALVDNDEALVNLPFSDMNAECVCLSQEKRTLWDPKVEGRAALLLKPGQGPGTFDWDRFQAKTNYAMNTSRTVVFSEALKLVESEFNELLKASVGMAVHRRVYDSLVPVVRYVLQIHGQDRKRVWENLPFGMFCQAIRYLLSPDFPTSKSDIQNALITKVKGLMLEFMEGVLQIEKSSEKLDERAIEACNFLRDEANFPAIVEEWAYVGTERIDRNMISHPFAPSTLPEQRAETIKFYEDLLEHEYGNKFPHLSVLGLLKIKEEMKSLERKEKNLLKEVWENLSYNTDE